MLFDGTTIKRLFGQLKKTFVSENFYLFIIKKDIVFFIIVFHSLSMIRINHYFNFQIFFSIALQEKLTCILV